MIEDLVSVLVANGPDPEYAGKLQTFGRFVGSWDVELTEFAEDGSAELSAAEWHFGWALGGRAIQDVWITPPVADQQARGAPAVEWGTALRYYDPGSDSWRMAWSGPRRGRQILFVGREEDGRIVLEGEEDRQPLRWIFSEIQDDSFVWEARTQLDDDSWRCVQQMKVHRRGAAR